MNGEKDGIVYVKGKGMVWTSSYEYVMENDTFI